MKILVPSAIDIDSKETPGWQVAQYDPGASIPQAHRDAEALVVWGNSPPWLREAAQCMKNLRWVQSLHAGPNSILDAGFDGEVVLCSGRGLHDGAVAEHTVGLLLTAVRGLHKMRDAQAAREWTTKKRELVDQRFRWLDGANVLIWGFGSIGRRIASTLTAFGSHVRGIARSPRQGDEFDVVGEEDVDAMLPWADALVMVLPSTATTKRVLDARRLAMLAPHAWLVNVGRGDTVDERALIEALRDQQIAGAALDVFEEEPLPSGSPLWDFANVIVSPHTAGGRLDGAPDLIIDNAVRLNEGRELRNVVDRGRGY